MVAINKNQKDINKGYKNNFNMYEKTLPLNLNKIILSKYLFMFLLMVIIISISFIISLFYKEDVEILNTLKYSLGYVFFINFSLIYVPVSYLFFILSNAHKRSC